ncbi:CG3280 [Drosophila busckii]|uniref:CG3280 n=1 Tax=Drosophila busckii TaxID=30019 RepID=A0A0M3QW74_DROBS|nr:CG3280 [Drosophila busckii]
MQSSADERREYYRGQKGRRTASQEDSRSCDLNDFHVQHQSSDADSATAYNQQQEQDYLYQAQNGVGDADVDDEEDYSISVSAIMQRRASVRGYRGKRGSRNSRRASSPMDHVLDSVERRRSKEGTNQESTQEQIFENIRLHKEVIQSVKLQPWPIRKKLKLVRQEIESHFGSGVASYFTFLRWLMWVNIMIAIPLVAFVIGPEYFATKHDETDPRKRMSEMEYKVAGNLFTFWEFEGYLKYSPMFYGYYSNTSGISTSGYKLPLAYFLTAVLVYIYSFVATLRKMAENSRNSKLSSKDDECVFSWKLFTGWDFMIGHAETAHNRIASVVVGFKEALLEEAEKKKDNRNWRVILQRILVNILVMGLLGLSGATVVLLVNHSEDLAKHDNWISRNAVNVTMTLLSFFLPMIFEALGLFENWHPRQQLRLQLARIMILNMLNLYSLMFSFIYKINSKEKPLQLLKRENASYTVELHNLMSSIEALQAMTSTTPMFIDSTTEAYNDELSTTSAWTFDAAGSTEYGFLASAGAALLTTMPQRIKCYNTTIKCLYPRRIMVSSKNIATTLMLLNLTTTTLPTTFLTTPMTTTEATTIRTTTALPTTWTTLPATTPTTWSTLPATTPTTTSTTITTTSTTITTPTTISSSSSTTTTAAPLTTEIESIYDYGSAEPEAAASTASSTTTTAAPGNDSYFNYVDYFEGEQLPYTANEDYDENDAASASTALADDPLAAALAQLDEPKARSRRALAAADNAAVWHTSRYSRRHRNETHVASVASTTETPSTAGRADFRTTLRAVTARPTRKLLSREEWSQMLKEMLANKHNLTIGKQTRRTTTSTAATTTRRRTTPATATTTAISSTTDDYFSESSSMSTSESTEDSDYTTQYSSTPFVIDSGDIASVGPTAYYEVHKLNECTLIVCPEDDKLFAGMTTDANFRPPTTVKQTPLGRQMKRLKEVQLTLKQIQTNLTTMCWETSLGQELSKVIVFDGVSSQGPAKTMQCAYVLRVASLHFCCNYITLCTSFSFGTQLMSIVAPLCIDFLRALFVRYVNQNWCWDMEKTFPQYGDFKIAENILTLINNQGQVWMGIFFSPGLVLINLVKLMIMMYFRSWIVLTCNVPHEVVFKASKSNNFYLSLLLTMLFLCVLPVGYAIVWLRPSWHCGPFSEYNRIAEFITNTTRNALPKQLHEPLDYLTSSSTVIPLLLLLILIIYYLISLTGALREANQDLRTQLQKEREEERKKIFKVPEVKQAEPTASTLTNRWRKVLEASSPVTPTQPPDFDTEEYKTQARKELISRIMKKALRKGSATSEEDSFVRRDDDDTDTEHQDSLPQDEEPKDKRFGLSRLQQIRRTRKPSLVDIVQIAKQERARSGSIVAGNSGAAAATNAGHFPIKEPHPKSRFKVDKHEQRESFREKKDAKHKQPPGAEHEAETNSRVVNERRISLLRRKHPKEQEAKPAAEPMPSTEQQAAAESHFQLVDEKQSPEQQEKETPQPLAAKESSGALGKFKFRKHRSKASNSTGTSKPEPDVFKFDDKSLEQSNLPEIPTAPVPEHLNSELASSNEPLPLPSPTPSLTQRQMNAEKLAALSRQGRKKIGSLLALVREAVNIKKDDEHASDESPGPTTPTYLAFTPPPPPSVLSRNSSGNALEMPPTPEPDSPTPSAPLHFGSSSSSSTTRPVVKPPTPPVVVAAKPTLATMDDLEELDMPGPITFPKRSASQRRRAMRQDSQSSIWSDNIPTITISTTGSDECIVEPETAPSPHVNGLPERKESEPSPSGPQVNIIKINIEDNDE